MSKLRGAIIGFGNIAEHGHWLSYAKSKDIDIIAIVDSSLLRRRAAQALKADLRVYSSAEELLRKEELDFVDICTPPSSHTDLALKGLERGCHVLCEKPLTLKASEYQTLSDAMKSADRTLYTVHNWKFAPIFQKAFGLLAEGRIGKVWHVEMFTLRDNACKGTTVEQPREDWRLQANLAGGGILVDHGWHAFYLLLNLVKEPPQKVLAKMLKDREGDDTLEEAVQTLVQFPKSNGYIHLTWRAMLRRNHVIVQGDKGTVIIDDDRLFVTSHDGAQEEIQYPAALSAGSHHPDWFEKLLPDFLDEIRHSSSRGRNFEEAGMCLALMLAAYESNLHGFKEVAIESPRAKVSNT